LVLLVLIASILISRLARQVRDDDAVMQALASQLGAPVRVTRWDGFWRYRLIEYIELPAIGSDDVDAVVSAINALSRGTVVLIRDGQLGEDDLLRMRVGLRDDALLAESINSGGRLQWEEFSPTMPAE
jgi:hypothetical protein